jgi:hypothetical protein
MDPHSRDRSYDGRHAVNRITRNIDIGFSGFSCLFSHRLGCSEIGRSVCHSRQRCTAKSVAIESCSTDMKVDPASE